MCGEEKTSCLLGAIQHFGIDCSDSVQQCLERTGIYCSDSVQQFLESLPPMVEVKTLALMWCNLKIKIFWYVTLSRRVNIEEDSKESSAFKFRIQGCLSLKMETILLPSQYYIPED